MLVSFTEKLMGVGQSERGRTDFSEKRVGVGGSLRADCS